MAAAPDRGARLRRLRAHPGAVLGLAVSLLAASILLGVHTERTMREQRAQHLVVQADILAGSVAAALAFDDDATTRQYLGAFRINPDLDAAGVYRLDGRLVAGFAAGGQVLPRTSRPGPPRVVAGQLIITAPVVQNGTRLGSVYLRAPTEPWTRRVERYVGIGIILLLAAILLTGLGFANAATTEANRRLKAEMEARAEAEAALRQSQKMEAMGQLTGGVAHDFNNLLMAASSGLELLERTTDPIRRERLKQGIRHAIDRGAKLTQQLLTFARRSPVKPEVVDLRRRVHDLSDLLERSLREDITIEIDIPPDLWPVEVDVSQLEVAILNVTVNARDAMPNGGPIRIAAHNVRGSNDTENRVHLTISDTGTGMPPDLVEKVFEPFFTTKGVGHGTGLGLSQVYGFARTAGGSVRIDSAEGEGTTVTIALPRANGAAAPSTTGIVDTDTAEVGPCQILLAEDDPQVAVLVEEMLTELGYKVTHVANAADALAAIDGDSCFDALLSDMVMPGDMGGLELARAVRERRPELPVLLMTGYSAAASAAADDDIDLLSKPFTLDALKRALKRAIADTPQAGASA